MIMDGQQAYAPTDSTNECMRTVQRMHRIRTFIAIATRTWVQVLYVCVYEVRTHYLYPVPYHTIPYQVRT